MISDNNGSAITTYTYDYRNRLTEVTQGGTVTATYTYSALDQRIGIKDNGTQIWTVYDGKSADAHPYDDFNGSGSLTERYLCGPGVITGAVVDELLARTSSGGTTAWYLPDNLGSVRDIVNTSGTELDHVVYDSFGNIVTETSASNGDRFKFAEMEYDSTTGQYFDHARNYDSSLGRFISLDPKGFAAGDRDLYRYVANDPTDETDPSGLMGGSAGYTAAYAPFYSATPGYYQWSGPSEDSLTLDDVIRSGDAFAAGAADSLTSGLSTQLRAQIYGEIATQNHQGRWFTGGQVFGGVVNTGLGFGTPVPWDAASVRDTAGSPRFKPSATQLVHTVRSMMVITWEARYPRSARSAVSATCSNRALQPARHF
jgi:RHS repeat-associated protein